MDLRLLSSINIENLKFILKINSFFKKNKNIIFVELELNIIAIHILEFLKPYSLKGKSS